MKKKILFSESETENRTLFPPFFFLFEMTCTFILNKTSVRVVILKVDCHVCFGLCTSSFTSLEA